MENLNNEEKHVTIEVTGGEGKGYVVFGGAGKEVKTSADLLMDTISSINGLTPTNVLVDPLYNNGDGHFVRFKLEEYPGWLFGSWIIDKVTNEDIIIHIFGSPTDSFNKIGGRQFTPWSASFCASMSIESEEFCKSLCNLCAVNRFVDYLRIIDNAGIFTDWIFNKTTIASWDKWDSAHEHGIFWYSIKNYFKKLFSWKRKKKCQKPRELLLD